jgi:DNA invertase Pin-like site-specific DNA recombinase
MPASVRMAKALLRKMQRYRQLVAPRCLLKSKVAQRLIEPSSPRQSLPWPSDTLVVCKLDRLARSTRDLLNTLAAIAEAGATFKSLGDPWCDTTSAHGKLMVTVLGGLAEFERHLILARTDEGRKRAQARGVRFGRKQKLTAHQRQEALARRANGEALVEIARSYNVSHSTISRLGAVFST